MHHYTRKLLTEWRKLELPFADENVVIAVSGGADSAALAAALHELVKAKKLKLKFTVAHFNHGLRGKQSNADEKFVKAMTERFGFGFAEGRAKKLKATDANLEEHAREERYEFLKKVASKTRSNIILTAHTLDDQAETFLLRLMRGSGADGLGAMRARRELEPNGKIALVRPLISWAHRKDTESFCRANKIEYRHDEMNEDERFQRVKVRKKLLPLMKEFNPKIVLTLSQTAAILRADSDALNELAAAVVENIRAPRRGIFTGKLLEVPESLRFRVLRLWLEAENKGLRRIDSVHLESILKLAASRKSGRLAELPGANCVIKEDGKLIFGKTKVEKSRSDN